MANRALGAPRLPGPEPVAEERLAAKIRTRALPLLKDRDSRWADGTFRLLMLACAVAILALVALIIYELVTKGSMAWHTFGWKFFIGRDWDPVNDQFGALPFVYGTIVSSILALVIAIPLAVGVAVFITEMCPRWLRGPLAFTTELLAAIPSVFYGFWASFVLVALLGVFVVCF